MAQMKAHGRSCPGVQTPLPHLDPYTRCIEANLNHLFSRKTQKHEHEYGKDV